MNIKDIADVRDLGSIADKIEAATGLRLAAKTPDDTVHGWIDGIQYPPGRSGVCDLCGTSFSNGHSCIKLSTYDQDEAPNELHKSTLRQASITPAMQEAIKALAL